MKQEPEDRGRRRLVAGLSTIGLVAAAGVRHGWAAQRATRPDLPEPAARSLSSLEGSGSALAMITQPGVYVLSQDLVVPAGISAVAVAADQVVLDLGGFTLRSGGGFAPAIVAEPPAASGITVRNGRIIGWDGAGIDLANVASARVLDLEIADNTGVGIRCGPGSLVHDCLLRGGGGAAIVAGANCVIRNSIVRGPGPGLVAGIGSRVEGCVVNIGGGLAIDALGGASVVGCVTAGGGIRALDGSTVEGCNAEGSTISVGSVCVVRGCRVSNSVVGIEVLGGQDRTRIIDNDVMDCGTGIRVASPCNLIVKNAVAASTTPYEIADGNAYGPIIDVRAGGDVSSILGSDHPLANQLYS